MTITKDMMISEVVKKYPEARETMLKAGMMCIGCHVAFEENLEQGAAAHGVDIKQLVEDLNKAIKSSKT